MDRRRFFWRYFSSCGSVGDLRVSSYGILKSQPFPGYAGLPSEHSVAPLGPARLSERFADPALPSVTGLRQQRRDGSVYEPSGPSSGGHKGDLIDLWATSHVFLPGHRVRLEIASSNFPRFGRNLNTGEDQATGSRRQTAAQTILQESSRINAADHSLCKRMPRVPRFLILFLPLRGPRASHSSAASTAAENRAAIPTDPLVGSPEPAQLNRRRKN